MLIGVYENVIEKPTDIGGEIRSADHMRPMEQEIAAVEDALGLLRFDIGRDQLLQLGSPRGAPWNGRAENLLDCEPRLLRYALNERCARRGVSSRPQPGGRRSQAGSGADRHRSRSAGRRGATLLSPTPYWTAGRCSASSISREARDIESEAVGADGSPINHVSCFVPRAITSLQTKRRAARRSCIDARRICCVPDTSSDYEARGISYHSISRAGFDRQSLWIQKIPLG